MHSPIITNAATAQLPDSAELGKAVTRRFMLFSSGIDPDEESSWKKNHKKD